MSNVAKMTLEEKLVQHLKKDTLMNAIGDEDMMTELVKRALHEALFQERSVGQGYDTRKEPSLAVQTAKQIASEACAEVAREMFAEVVERPAVKQAIHDALPHLVLNALKDAVAGDVRNAFSQASLDAEDRIRSAIAQSQM